jgi:hypothetical protein
MSVTMKNRTLLIEIGEGAGGALVVSPVYDENHHGDPRDHGYSLPDIELSAIDEDALLDMLFERLVGRFVERWNDDNDRKVGKIGMTDDIGKALLRNLVDLESPAKIRKRMSDIGK